MSEGQPTFEELSLLAAKFMGREDFTPEQAVRALLGVYTECLSYHTQCAGCADLYSQLHGVDVELEKARARIEDLEKELKKLVDIKSRVKYTYQLSLDEYNEIARAIFGEEEVKSPDEWVGYPLMDKGHFMAKLECMDWENKSFRQVESHFWSPLKDAERKPWIEEAGQ